MRTPRPGAAIELFHGCTDKTWIPDVVVSVDGDTFVTAIGCLRNVNSVGAEWRWPVEKRA
jgi:hypothetical protein